MNEKLYAGFFILLFSGCFVFMTFPEYAGLIFGYFAIAVLGACSLTAGAACIYEIAKGKQEKNSVPTLILSIITLSYIAFVLTK